MKITSASVDLPPFSLNGRSITPSLMLYAQRDTHGQPICAIQLYSEDGAYGRLSTNIGRSQPGPWSFWLKHWDENAPLIEPFFQGCQWASFAYGENDEARCLIDPDLLPNGTVQKICELMEWDPVPAAREHKAEAHYAG